MRRSQSGVSICGMNTFNDVIIQEVVRYMRAAGLTQAALGKICGLHQTGISKRLRGQIEWSFADLDRLSDGGVPIKLTFSILEEDAS